jgi:hypothetical protein
MENTEKINNELNIDNLPVINGVIIKSIELLNGVYICSGLEHIESIIPDKINSNIKDLFKRRNLMWIEFLPNEVIEYQTTNFNLVYFNYSPKKKVDDNYDDIVEDILNTLLNKIFN